MAKLTYQELKDMHDRMLRRQYPPDKILVHIDDLLHLMRALRKSGFVLVRQVDERGGKLSIYDVFTADYQEKAGYEIYVDKMRFGEPGKMYLLPDPFKQREIVYEKPIDNINLNWEFRFGTWLRERGKPDS